MTDSPNPEVVQRTIDKLIDVGQYKRAERLAITAAEHFDSGSAQLSTAAVLDQGQQQAPAEPQLLTTAQMRSMSQERMSEALADPAQAAIIAASLKAAHAAARGL